MTGVLMFDLRQDHLILVTGVLMFVERSETGYSPDPTDRCVDV